MATTTTALDQVLALLPSQDMYAIRDSLRLMYSANSRESNWTAEQPSRGSCSIIAGYCMQTRNRQPRKEYATVRAALVTMCASLTAGIDEMTAFKSFIVEVG
jgi:hypothetical protein